jgi:hypothetical protein
VLQQLCIQISEFPSVTYRNSNKLLSVIRDMLPQAHVSLSFLSRSYHYFFEGPRPHSHDVEIWGGDIFARPYSTLTRARALTHDSVALLRTEWWGAWNGKLLVV